MKIIKPLTAQGICDKIFYEWWDNVNKEGIGILSNDLVRFPYITNKIGRVLAGESEENPERDGNNATRINDKLDAVWFNPRWIDALQQYLFTAEWVGYQKKIADVLSKTIVIKKK